MNSLAITLSIETINLLLTAASELPFKVSHKAIEELIAQCKLAQEKEIEE